MCAGRDGWRARDAAREASIQGDTSMACHYGASRACARVREPNRAAAQARHSRETEGLSIAQIAERFGRSPAALKAYFYDPSDDNKRPTDRLAR
jgi:AraC-like DNA-binding protein